MAQIEFYVGKSEKHIAVVDDAAVPREGEMLSIWRKSYRVTRVTWAVDHQDKVKLRANVELEIVSG
jgi:hypothetical protein